MIALHIAFLPWPVRKTELPWRQMHFDEAEMKRGKRVHNAVMSSWNKGLGVQKGTV